MGRYGTCPTKCEIGRASHSFCSTIVVHLLTPIKRFFRIYKRNFPRRCVAAFVGGANNYTTHFAGLAVLSSAYDSETKFVNYH